MNDSLSSALEAGAAAMGRVESKAESVYPGFSDDAQECMLAHLATVGSASGEELSNTCKDGGITPHDDRAFGPVINRLFRSRKIIRLGYRQRAKGHGTSGGTVWGLSE